VLRHRNNVEERYCEFVFIRIASHTCVRRVSPKRARTAVKIAASSGGLWRGAHRKWNRRPPEYWTPPNRGNVEEHVAVDQDIYAEVSIRFERIEELEEALPPADFVRLPLPWEAAFLAGKCFVRYRRRRGGRRSPLPDFYIGAHAAVAGLALFTRDPSRYRTYFPGVEIIAP
jgi:predicted nucleic acid-binding protein